MPEITLPTKSKNDDPVGANDDVVQTAPKSASFSDLAVDNDNSGTTFQPPVPTPSIPTNNVQVRQKPPAPQWSSNPSSFGAGFTDSAFDDMGLGDGFDAPYTPPPMPSMQQKQLTPQERVKMIEEVFELVLSRKPDTRDLNYYKYSTLNETEIIKQLLQGNEHKQLVKDGAEFKNLKARSEQTDTKLKALEGQIADQVEEFKHLTMLLTEKNRYIQYLRSRGVNSFTPQVQDELYEVEAEQYETELPIQPQYETEQYEEVPAFEPVQHIEDTYENQYVEPTPVKVGSKRTRSEHPLERFFERLRAIFSA